MALPQIPVGRRPTQNLGRIDRVVRGGVAAGLFVLMALALTRSTSIFAIACVVLLAGLALGLLATAVTGYCPIYARVISEPGRSNAATKT